MNANSNDQGVPQTDAGFTLVEVLVAIVVLVFGLIAVTNLLLVGASNKRRGEPGHGRHGSRGATDGDVQATGSTISPRKRQEKVVCRHVAIR